MSTLQIMDATTGNTITTTPESVAKMLKDLGWRVKPPREPGDSSVMPYFWLGSECHRVTVDRCQGPTYFWLGGN